MCALMSEAREFFRICPACGRRFHIKLVSKTLVDDKKDVRELKQGTISPHPSGYGGIYMWPVVVTDKIPVTVDIKDFQFSYKCGHCGHTWSEMHVEENRT